MSFTAVKILYPHADPYRPAKTMSELPNSWGSAPYVWEVIYRKYINDGGHFLINGDRLWPLGGNKSLPNHERAVLLMTFDNFYTLRKNFVRAAGDIRRFLEENPSPPGNVNHWPAIADIFLASAKKRSVPAIGFRCTSVSEDLWNGHWNEETQSHDPVDWDRKYEVYDCIDTWDE
jgi:hypothetical protein